MLLSSQNNGESGNIFTCLRMYINYLSFKILFKVKRKENLSGFLSTAGDF